MIQPERVHELNHESIDPRGKYVLYLMHASQRSFTNHALEYTIRKANELKLPPLVCFGLMDAFPEANERHYAFLVPGLADVDADLRERGIKFVIRHGLPSEAALYFAKQAAMVVVDCGYLRIQKSFFDDIADHAGKLVVQVETDVVVPVETVTNKHEYAARTIRPKIHKRLDEFLHPLRSEPVHHPSLKLKVTGNMDPRDSAKLLKTLKLDRSVHAVGRLKGGQVEARRLIGQFIKNHLDGYHDNRNEPAKEITSMMAAYLHFGQVSPLELALAVKSSHAPAADRDAYLEELIIRRELSMNFVHFCPADYDKYTGMPAWAQKSLAAHAKDKRQKKYTLHQLENAETDDAYWNAAQQEMTKTGFMHNYMRMYWGKKILEWTESPKEGYERTLHINNKYFLCGRDPNSFANVGWIYGLHDRPWGPERPVFGLIRYMNAAGLKRKFDMPGYIKAVEKM